jgi:hypothetical protein
MKRAALIVLALLVLSACWPQREDCRDWGCPLGRKCQPADPAAMVHGWVCEKTP